MATKYKTGDTWPPIEGTVEKNGSPVNISAADRVRLVMRVGVFTAGGDVDVIDDGTVPLRGQWQYILAVDDLSMAGEVKQEVEVTWDDASVPPKIETFPNDAADNPSIHVTEDLD